MIFSHKKENRAKAANKKASEIQNKKDEVSNALKKFQKSAGISRRKKKRNVRRELQRRRRNKQRHRRREAGKTYLVRLSQKCYHIQN